MAAVKSLPVLAFNTVIIFMILDHNEGEWVQSHSDFYKIITFVCQVKVKYRDDAFQFISVSPNILSSYSIADEGFIPETRVRCINVFSPLLQKFNLNLCACVTHGRPVCRCQNWGP